MHVQRDKPSKPAAPAFYINEKTMKTKDEYIENLASELKEWSAEIDLLTAKIEHTTADVKIKYVEELDILDAKRHLATAKMKELKEAGEDAWETVKKTADAVWDDLRIGLTDTTSKFK